MPYRRRGLLIALLAFCIQVLVIVGVVAVAHAAYWHAHEGARLQRAADSLRTPTGWTYIGETKEAGSPFLCVVSCPHATLTKVYRTEVEPMEACAAVKAEVIRAFRLSRRTKLASGCWWTAPVRSVGPDADVGAYTEPAANVRASELPHGAASSDDGIYVWVTFIGGRT